MSSACNQDDGPFAEHIVAREFSQEGEVFIANRNSEPELHAEIIFPRESGVTSEVVADLVHQALVVIRESNADESKKRTSMEAGITSIEAVHKERNDEPSPKRVKTDEVFNRKANNDQWDTMFERLVAYKAEKGDCLVPKRYAADPKLGTWVETQRVQYKRLQREFDASSGTEAVQPNKRLDQKRLEKLQSIGFAWSAKGLKTTKSPTNIPTEAISKPKQKKPPPDDARTRARNLARSRAQESLWNEMYERLVKYKEEHGNTLVPRKYEKDPRLASWVETQRILWNRDFRSANIEEESSPEFEGHASMEIASSEAASLVITGDEWGRATPTGMLTVGDCIAAVADSVGGESMDFDVMLAASMAEEAVMMTDELTEEQRDAAVVEAVAVAAAEAIEDPNYHGEDVKYKAALAVMPKRLTKERKEKLDHLGFVWSLRTKRIDDHWDEMFRQLVEYRNKYGDCLVPSRFEENLKLGKWVETQRYEYTKLQRAATETDETGFFKRVTNPRLTEERLKRLEAIGFEWKVRHKMKRYYDKQWDQMFERLLAFRDRNGHCMVPKRYAEDVKLGTWVHTQRIQYRKLMDGYKTSDRQSDRGSDGGSDLNGEDFLGKGEDEISFRLTDDRRKRLTEIGFVWSVRDSEKTQETSRIARNSYDDQWDAMYNQLRIYKEKYGHCLVPKRFSENPKLGTWVDTQRVQFKKMKKKLAAEGIEYDGPSEESVMGDSGINNQTKPVVGRLTDDRIRRLENLGFVWSLRDDWQKHYNELKEFKKENGHCNVPARYTKNRRLGIWVSAQRQQYKALKKLTEDEKKNARLTQERIDQLNQLGFTWTIRSRDTLGESWNQRLQELKDFKAIHGHCMVPSRYPPNPELGIWVGTQRTQYRMYLQSKSDTNSVNSNESAYNFITEERIRILDELGFVWALRGNEIINDNFKGDPDLNELNGAIENEALQAASALANAGFLSSIELDSSVFHSAHKRDDRTLVDSDLVGLHPDDSILLTATKGDVIVLANSGFISNSSDADDSVLHSASRHDVIVLANAALISNSDFDGPFLQSAIIKHDAI